MSFTHPGWLAGGLAACLIMTLLWWRYDARQYTALARFVSANLRHQLTRSISVGKRRLQRGLYLIALMLLFVALAGPLWGFRWELVNRRGNEIVFAIDTSRSMTTPDIKPDRLTRAKLAIDDFVQKLDGDAVGIVAFAGTAYLVCPITLDYAAFHESLGAVDTNTIPRGGTNISSAIIEAQGALRRRPGSDKILILVTDGEDLEGSALTTAQAAAHEDGLKIYTVGVGSAAGELIPLPREQGGGFVKDESGDFVKSRLDEAALQAIATATGGGYVPLGIQGEGLETIYKTVLGPLAKHDLASRRQKIYTERYQWPLAGSLAALLLSLLIGTRRRHPRQLPVRTAAALSALLLMTLTRQPAHADAAVAAATATANPKQPLLEYNAGIAAYQAGQFPQAAQAFQQSISHSPSGDAQRLADQEDAYYNLGNTLYRTGQKTEQSAPQDTIQKWTDAVKAYDTALQLRPDDADSKFNRDLVKRKLDALKQQKPPPDQDKDKDKNQGQGQGKGQGQGQPPPGQQGQPPQNQPPPQGQQPPQPGQQPPPPPGQQPSPGQPPPGQQPPQNKQGGGDKGEQPPPNTGNPDQNAADSEREADQQRIPGQMSREEARELLDSVKGDEKHALGAPMAERGENRTPDKPVKDW